MLKENSIHKFSTMRMKSLDKKVGKKMKRLLGGSETSDTQRMEWWGLAV